MPLQPPSPRRELHLRSIELRGFERDDGLFDIEGRLIDCKSERFEAAGGRTTQPLEPIHDIRVRLTVDLQLHIVAAAASSDATPYTLCTDAETSVQALVGSSMGRGWARTVREFAGGTAGCTHMQEVLLTLGSAAFQTLVPFRRELQEQGRPPLLETCVTFARHSPVVASRWPQYYLQEGSAS